MGKKQQTNVPSTPGQYIKEELEARGWSRLNFAQILGWSPEFVDNLLAGGLCITPNVAQALAEAFGTSREVWLNLQAELRRKR